MAPGLGGGGLAPTAGLGLAPMGGGTFAAELEGLELSGVEPAVVAAGFFQGVGPPFDPPIPGNTATGFADALAVTADGLGTVEVGRGLEGGGGGGGGPAGAGSR